MDELTVKTEEFFAGLRGSSVMRRFMAAKRALCEEEELCKRVLEYRAASAGLRRSGMGFDDEKRLSHIYWKLMLSDTARAYFEAEKSLAAYLRFFFAELEQSFEGWSI